MKAEGVFQLAWELNMLDDRKWVTLAMATHTTEEERGLEWIKGKCWGEMGILGYEAEACPYDHIRE